MILFFEIFRIPLLVVLVDGYVLRLRLIELGLREVELLAQLSEILLYLLLDEYLLVLHRIQLVPQAASLGLPHPRLLLSLKERLSGSREGKI
jgi:hypothetical protein